MTITNRVTDVFNLWTGEVSSSYTLPAFDAVRAAYAQIERKDFNTWNYHNYNHLIKVARSKKDGYSVVTCGDQSVLFKDGELHGPTEAGRVRLDSLLTFVRVGVVLACVWAVVRVGQVWL